MSGQWGSACSSACGWCGACSAGPDPRHTGICQQCSGPIYDVQPGDQICDECSDSQRRDDLAQRITQSAYEAARTAPAWLRVGLPEIKR